MRQSRPSPPGIGSLSPVGRPALPPWVQAKLDEQARQKVEADALRRLAPVNQPIIAPKPSTKWPKFAPSQSKPSPTARFTAPPAPAPAPPVDRAFERGTPEYYARLKEILNARTQGIAPGYGSLSTPGEPARRTDPTLSRPFSLLSDPDDQLTAPRIPATPPKSPRLADILRNLGNDDELAAERVTVSSPSPTNPPQQPPRQPRPVGPPPLSPEAEEALFASVLAQDDATVLTTAPSAYAEWFTNEHLLNQPLETDEAAYRGGTSVYRQFLDDERLMEEALEFDEKTASPSAGPVRLDLLDQLPAMFAQTGTVYEAGPSTWAAFAGDGRRGLLPEERFTAVAENLGYSGDQIIDLLDGVPVDEVGPPQGGFTDVGRIDRAGVHAALRGEETDVPTPLEVVKGISKRANQATLGFLTGENPSDSVNRASAGARGDETFRGDDLGFVRHLPEGHPAREALGYVGEKVTKPSFIATGLASGGISGSQFAWHLARTIGPDAVRWIASADPQPIPLPEFDTIPDAPNDIDSLFAPGGLLDPSSAEGQWLYSAFIGDGVDGQGSDDRLATVLYHLGFRGESLAQLMEGTPGSEIGLPTGDNQLGPGLLDLRDAKRLVSPSGSALDPMQIAAIMTSPDVRARATREFGARFEAR